MTPRDIARVALLGVLLSSAIASAHEFWLRPRRFWLAPGEPTSLAVLVGHGTDRAPWRMRLKRIVRFVSIGPDGIETDRRDTLREGPGAADATLVFEQRGLHRLVLETNDAFNSLPPDRFEAYLIEEGLTPALNARQSEGTHGEPGRERYSRRAKVLVQVGPTMPNDVADAMTRTGLSLEITPEISPYRPGGASRLPVRVTENGRALPGATVRLTDLRNDAKPIETRLTDRSGRGVVNLPCEGQWQLGVVWTRRIHGDADADFNTVFSSLTFGFQLPRNLHDPIS